MVEDKDLLKLRFCIENRAIMRFIFYIEPKNKWLLASSNIRKRLNLINTIQIISINLV